MKLTLTLKRWQALAGLTMVLLSNLGGAVETADEEAVKIAYLAKFPRYADWPAEALDRGGAPFQFCVIGDADIKTVVAAIEGQHIKERHAVVIDMRRGNSLKDCHVLYVSHTESWRIRSILEEIKTRPVLSISDAEGFARQGGIIGLIKQDHRLKFEINLSAAAQAGLQISAQLAKLAVKTY